MAWRRTGDKPLSEYTAAYMHHLAYNTTIQNVSRMLWSVSEIMDAYWNILIKTTSTP